MKNVMMMTMAVALLAGGGVAQDPAKKSGGDVAVTFDVEGKTVDVMVIDGVVKVLVDKKAKKFTRAKTNDLTFVTYSEPKRRIIGVEVKELDEPLAAQAGIEKDEAMVIVRVEKGGPAAKAGIQKYDVVTSIQGNKPATLGRLRASLDKLQAGDPIVLDLLRAGRPRTVRVTVGEEPTPKIDYLQNLTFDLSLTPQQADGRVFLNPVVTTRPVYKVDESGSMQVEYVQLNDLTLTAPRYNLEASFADMTKPAAGTKSSQGDRLAALERRLERIEKLLTRIANKK